MTVLLVTVVIGILVIGTSTTSLIDRQVSSRQRGGTEAYYVAQAGLDRLKTALFLAVSDAMLSDSGICGPPDVSFEITPGFWLRPGDVSPAIAHLDGRGWYELQFERRFGFYVLTAVGWIGDSDTRAAQATLQLVATAGVAPFGAYDNAIFTQQITTTTGNRTVTGTIAAYGSVHIVDGDVRLDDPDIAVEYGGGSGVFNNYNGHLRGSSTDALEQAIKALGVGRAYPDDLCSRLKLESGSVQVDSNRAGLGAAGDVFNEETGQWDPWMNPDTPGGPTAQYQSLEGIYLGGPDSTVYFQGNAEREIYARSGIRSGLDGGYFDLHLEFPEIENGFPHDIVDHALLTAENCALIAEDGDVLRLPPLVAGTVECGESDHSLVWDEEDQVLRINGNISIESADLAFLPRPDEITVLTYEGLGKLRVGSKDSTGASGRIEIGMEVLPLHPALNYCTEEDPAPDRDRRLCSDAQGLGLETPGDVDFTGVTGGGATVSAVVFAEGVVNLPQQVTIVGSIVGTRVHVQQVPRVVWHPDVSLFAEAMGMTSGEPNPGSFAQVSTEIR